MPTVTLRPLDQLTREWDTQCHSPASRHAFRRLVDTEPSVAALARSGARDLGDLVAALRPDGAGWHRDQAAAVFRALLRSQSSHPLVVRATLQAVLPGLVSVARRLSWGAGGEWEDGGSFLVDTITTAWEVITEWTGQDRRYAVLDLLSAVRCRMRRQLMRHRSLSSHVIPVAGASELAEPATPGRSAPEELAKALDDLAGRGLDTADAAVLYANRVLGYSITELSSMTGRSRRHLGERRDRAAQVLTA